MGTQYCTPDQLDDLGIPTAALAGISVPKQNAALLAASVLIDSYLGGRFKLPLESYGGDLTLCCAKIAAFNLIAVRGMAPGNASYDTLREGWKDQLNWLKDVSAGRATPAFPTAKDVNEYEPEGRPYVVAPAAGGIGTSGGALGHDDDRVSVGTVGTPRLRGW